MDVNDADIEVLQGYGVEKLLSLWTALRAPAIGQLVDTSKLPDGCPGVSLNAALQQAVRLIRQTVKEVLIEKLNADEEATQPAQPAPPAVEPPMFTPPLEGPSLGSPPPIPPSGIPGEVTDPSLR